MTDNPIKLRRLTNYDNHTDEVFICCASFEERCLGAIRLFENYIFSEAYIFAYDHPNEARENNFTLIKETLGKLGNLIELRVKESDPVPAIIELSRHLEAKKEVTSNNLAITLDISTFTKRHLLLLLKRLDELNLWKKLRVLYSKPEQYITDLFFPMSFGIKQIESITGFSSIEPLNKPLLLIIFAGYECDRAMALYQDLDPNETVIIIPKPAYHYEWEGRTEYMNRRLIDLIGTDKIYHTHSTNPNRINAELNKLVGPSGKYNLTDWYCCFSPLGTKPQTLGLYMYWRQHPEEFSIIYAQPLEHNERFYSSGIGQTWQLLKTKLK